MQQHPRLCGNQHVLAFAHLRHAVTEQIAHVDREPVGKLTRHVAPQIRPARRPVQEDHRRTFANDVEGHSPARRLILPLQAPLGSNVHARSILPSIRPSHSQGTHSLSWVRQGPLTCVPGRTDRPQGALRHRATSADSPSKQEPGSGALRFVRTQVVDGTNRRTTDHRSRSLSAG